MQYFLGGIQKKIHFDLDFLLRSLRCILFNFRMEQTYSSWMFSFEMKQVNLSTASMWKKWISLFQALHNHDFIHLKFFLHASNIWV